VGGKKKKKVLVELVSTTDRLGVAQEAGVCCVTEDKGEIRYIIFYCPGCGQGGIGCGGSGRGWGVGRRMFLTGMGGNGRGSF